MGEFIKKLLIILLLLVQNALAITAKDANTKTKEYYLNVYRKNIGKCNLNIYKQIEFMSNIGQFEMLIPWNECTYSSLLKTQKKLLVNGFKTRTYLSGINVKNSFPVLEIEW